MTDEINAPDSESFMDSVLCAQSDECDSTLGDDRRFNRQSQENPDRRASNKWIYDSIRDHKKENNQFKISLKEQKEEIKTVNDKVTKVQESIQSTHNDLTNFIGDIKKAIPDQSAHLLAHKQLIEEEERRRERAEEAEKLKKEIRNKFILAAVQGAGIALLGIIILGIQAQFGIWVNKVVDTPKAVVEVKK